MNERVTTQTNSKQTNKRTNKQTRDTQLYARSATRYLVQLRVVKTLVFHVREDDHGLGEDVET